MKKSMQSMGGTARASALTAGQRRAISKKAAKARWRGHKPAPRPKKILRPLSRQAADRIRKLVDCCGAAQQWDRLCLFPGKNPKTGLPFNGLTAELDMLLRGFEPVIKCKEVK